jgi:hypothetical protein
MLKGRDHLGDLGTGGRLTQKDVCGRVSAGLVAGSWVYGKETSGFIKGLAFLDEQSDYRILRKAFSSWS